MKLFRPLWDSKNEKRAVKAVEKIKDETKLARVVEEARCLQACETAAEKLTDQNLIILLLQKNIITYNSYIDRKIRFTLAKKLDDTNKAQQILSEIAANLSDNYSVSQSPLDFGNAVLDCITEQSALFYVAAHGRISQIYEKAIERLTDTNLLYELAKGRANDKGHLAIQQLNDQKLLEDLAINDKEMNVRILAAQKLINQSLAQSIYAEIAKFDDDIAVKTAAIKNFDKNNLQFIPEIVENLLSVHHNYSNEKVNDFIQFVYKVSQQEQKQILYRYKGKILPHQDHSYTTGIHSDYTDTYSDGGYDGHNDYRESYHTDEPEITIWF